MMTRWACLWALMLAMAGSAHAQEGPPPSSRPNQDGPTLRFGGSWQDPKSPESGPNLRSEILFAKPEIGSDTISRLLIPAPVLGVSAHLGRGTSFAYAAALWTIPLTERFFAEVSLGGALNNGVSAPEPGRAALGCHAGFREEIGLGWIIDAQWSVLLSLEHYSNAHLCDRNRGLTNFGLMIGRRF